MKNLDAGVDEYIDKAEDFAKPVLNHWRKLVHKVCPGVEEAIKWSLPHFDYKGGMMFVMASYKQHCSFTFLNAGLMKDKRLKESKTQKPIQRYLGKISSLTDLPPDEEFISFLKEAMALNEKGIKPVRAKADKPAPVELPDYFEKALKSKPKAKEVFETKSPSFRKNYIVWIADAKTDTTRGKRIEQALEWIAEGKDRFWQYEK